MRAELYLDGQTRPVHLSDMTPEGAKLSTTLILEPGTSIALGVHLTGDEAYAMVMDFIHLDMRVAFVDEVMENGTIRYTCVGSNPLCRNLGIVA